MSIEAKMAWRNIWRNPRRTILTLCAIAFASLLLVFMMSFQFGSYDAMINASVRIHTGHLQIQAPDYQDKQKINLVVPDPADVGRILNQTPGIEAYTFRARGFALAASKERSNGVLVIGIDPHREARVSTLKSLIRQGSYLPQENSDQESPPALIGNLLAKNLRVKPGDELTLLGQARDGSVAATVVTITGIYSSGLDAFDRGSVHIPLKNFRNIYSMGSAVHEVVVVATSLGQVATIKKKVARAITLALEHPLAVLDWEDLMPGLRQAIEMDLVSGIIFYLILIIVVAFSILNTFLMSIFERTREFGVLMAIGTTPGRLTRLVLIESMAMTIIGIFIGITLGSMVTWYFQSHGIDISGSSDILKQYGISGRLYPRLSMLSAVSGPIAVLFITFLAALYPALKVRKLRPVEAMTHI